MKKLMMFVAGAVLLLGAVTWAGLDLVYRSTLDFDLYKNESYYGGAKQTELLSFLDGGRRVIRAQQKIAKSAGAGPRRVFHAKQHGCLTGRLVLRTERPQDLSHVTYTGLFDPARADAYDVVVRFSNGVGINQPDSKPDVRGAAIKIFDVLNSSTGARQTVDLLMTNSPTPFGRDFLEFAKFMDDVASFGPTLGGVAFSTHLRASESLIRTSGLPVISDYKIRSLATRRFWSGHAYLLGRDLAMKFNIIPTETAVLPVSRLKAMGDNYLREDLRQRTMNGEVRYTLALQLEKDKSKTPIEDALKEWTETDTPSIAVADLILDRQDFSKPQIDQECEGMRFTPGHYIPEHRPLGNMGRGRLFGYEASQIGRHAADEEPGHDLVEHWRQLNKIE